ncbi:S8 family serine peptidase [Mycoplasmopsis felis]|uniref:S8 family serine peptidase n=1 Tax=Mycoplasmopsis felis TaxID=33923 RepID=UPI002AFF87CF|nr:S8 family serine peptidase [Mycoplasmopsis felis]WQQ05469.1 S8 family serine peptidase [Mycoplasmopsis felis]
MRKSILYSLIFMTTISGSIYPLFFDNKIETKEINEYKINEINLNLYSNENSEETNSYFNMGVSRIEIMISSNFENKIEKLKNYLFKLYKEQIPIFYGEKTKILSIAKLEKINNDDLLNKIIAFFKNEKIAINQIYDFKSKKTYDNLVLDINKEIFKNQIHQNTSNWTNYFDQNFSFINNNFQFESIGLSKDILLNHWRKYNNEEVFVGILESGGVINTSYEAFKWGINNKKEIYYRNHWLFRESFSDHADKVAEIIIGDKFGINKTANLISVQLLLWNGLSGEMEYLLNKTSIINHSWGLKKEHIYKNYNWISEYFDFFIKNNPELINIVSSGNYYDDLENPIKEIDSNALSKNSIVIGSFNSITKQKYDYSQIGNNKNYITTVAPGKFVFEKTKNKDWKEKNKTGTSYSAPVITGMASMLKQSHKEKFAEGPDSIIFKTALLVGSEPIKNQTELISNEVGAGIPNYNKVSRAIENTVIYKINSNKESYFTIKLKKGQKIRAGISYLLDSSENVDTNIDLEFWYYNENLRENQDMLENESNYTNFNIELIESDIYEDGEYYFKIIPLKRKNNKEVQVAFSYLIEENSNEEN